MISSFLPEKCDNGLDMKCSYVWGGESMSTNRCIGYSFHFFIHSRCTKVRARATSFRAGEGALYGVGLVRRGDGMGDVLWRGLAELSDFFEIF